MDQTTLNTIRSAEQAVRQLLEQCRKPGPLYDFNPKAVAQVNRTGKWLLNAIGTLQKELNRKGDNQAPTKQ